LVDFWAPWCGPCRAVAPVLEELARAEAGRVVIAKVNVDEEPSLAQRYGVQAIPTLLVFKDGRIVDTMVGAPPKAELARRVTALLCPQRHVAGPSGPAPTASSRYTLHSRLPYTPSPFASRHDRLRAAPAAPYPRVGGSAMRVLVLGGGIAGVTAAYFLAKDGH